MNKNNCKFQHTYLVFSIFKNCKISENCINLKALKNLKPVREEIEKLVRNVSSESQARPETASYLSYFHPSLSSSMDSC